MAYKNSRNKPQLKTSSSQALQSFAADGGHPLSSFFPSPPPPGRCDFESLPNKGYSPFP